uniref:C-type lectin domain-containing protein n=1 Tax=Strongyloides stercoralis TaxID=6248 RepID=A0AAF5DIF8_STRER
EGIIKNDKKMYKTDGNVRLQTSIMLMENNWQYLYGSWYKFFDIEMFWDEASEFCKQFDGHLVSIDNQRENDFVDKLRKKNDIWIGFTKPRNGYYQWSDNSDVNFVNWGPTQPNEPDVDCAIMAYSKDHTGKWHDYSCDGKMPQYFVCKTKI